VSAKRRTPAAGSELRSHRFVFDVGEDASNDDALIHGIIAWIEERDPDFFLPEND
jgi:hypothetical protein